MNDCNTLQSLTILLADDDDIFRETTAKTLRKLFKEVYTATDGAGALNVYHALNPNIIMLDIRMGSMSGLEVAQEIRKDNTAIPIFIVSSYSETAEILKACELNLVKYLVKPFTYDGLVDVLKKCVVICNKERVLLKKINDTTCYNPYSKNLIQNSKTIPLTKNEIAVLEYMLSNQGHFVGYEALVSVLGGTMTNIALQNLVFRLRKKIGHDSLKNLAKMGYILL